MKNHRKHTRIVLRLAAEISGRGSGTVQASTVNISFGGCFLTYDRTKCTLKAGDRIKTALLPRMGGSALRLDFQCHVAHVRHDGLGVAFLGVEAGAYEHFKNLMVLNSEEPEQLLKELEKNPGLEKEKGS